MDEDVAKIFNKTLMKQGIKFLLSTKVDSCKIKGKEIITEIDLKKAVGKSDRKIARQKKQAEKENKNIEA